MARDAEPVPDPRRKQRDSLLETLESILVAFVLAFIFRAFLVEAFVIPTGSMAPTLYGEHVEHPCAYCGYEFAVGLEEAPRSERLTLPARVACPNCTLAQAPDQARYGGDRILALKYLYHFTPPERWDVLVFRNPNLPSQNYIKRLVALPGETVELLRGDVTIRRPEEAEARVMTKPDRAQEALWMIVHDTHHEPTRGDWQPRWTPGEGWTRSGPGFALEAGPDEPSYLEYQHFDGRGNAAPITDYYAYSRGRRDGRGLNPVTDLAVRVPVKAGTARTVVIVEMRAYRDRFRWELTAAGSGRPSRILANGHVVAESMGGVLPVGRRVRILAANVDRKLMLCRDGWRLKRLVRPLEGAAATAEGDPTYEPRPLSEEERREIDAAADGPAAVRIGARSGPVALGWVRLERDVYYRSRGEPGETGHGTQGHPFTLEADQFFVMGDNSPSSFDSRWWRLSEPVVDRRSLVGKAFFIYWPAAGWRVGFPIAPDVTRFGMVH